MTENSKTFSIYTLGCKLNYSESSQISRELQENGFSISESPNYIILNTCTVTQVAEKKARQLISSLRRKNPLAELIVIGCMVEREKFTLEKLEGIAKVFGSADKMQVINYLCQIKAGENPTFFSSFSSNDRTRSFLKIQDGCDYHCSYCAVASARGESRSDTLENVLINMQKIAQLGVKEVVLTGVNTGDFGKNNKESFYELLKQIDEAQIIKRVRISSIEPNLLTDEIIELVAQSSVLMPHFHIPLQSGNNRILGLMKRRYKRELFAEKILRIKELMPHACIAVDYISGFPTETEEDFQDGFEILNNLPISYLHVFTYSKRPKTPAAEMVQVKDIVKKERTSKLLQLSEIKKNKFIEENIGTMQNVLFEDDKKNGLLFGFTENYIRIGVPINEILINTIEEIEVNLEKTTTP